VSARPKDSLRTLLSDDSRFRQADTALDAYAEAWALNHFMISTRLKDYVRYQQRLSAKPLLIYSTTEERLSEFQQAFGEDLATLDAEFLRYATTLR